MNEFFREAKPALLPFFGLHKNGNHFELRRDTDEINAKLSRMGMFVLITNADISGEQALQLYKGKDGVEKCFDSLKNFVKAKYLNSSVGSSKPSIFRSVNKNLVIALQGF